VGQWLGNHRAAHDDVGGVDVGAHCSVASSLGEEPLQAGIDALSGSDCRVVDERRCTAQWKYELIAQP
jgi:hypothetical protein